MSDRREISKEEYEEMLAQCQIFWNESPQTHIYGCKVDTTNMDNFKLVTSRAYTRGETILTEKALTTISSKTLDRGKLLDVWTNYINRAPMSITYMLIGMLYPRIIGNDWMERAVILSRKLKLNIFNAGRFSLFYNASYIQHSCNPNAMIQYIDETTASITALKDLLSGTEITIDYIPGEMKNRQQLLQEMYEFVCNCGYCSNPQPNFKIHIIGKWCWNCKAENPGKCCSRCRLAKYCNTECQKANWPLHKTKCKIVSKTMTYNLSEFAVGSVTRKTETIDPLVPELTEKK
jgi:hypothetical protein